MPCLGTRVGSFRTKKLGGSLPRALPNLEDETVTRSSFQTSKGEFRSRFVASASPVGPVFSTFPVPYGIPICPRRRQGAMAAMYMGSEI